MSQGTTRSGIISAAMVVSIAGTHSRSTGIGHPDVQQMPESRHP
jgi:hypothetical protein